jgi:hypothetical protein
MALAVAVIAAAGLRRLVVEAADVLLGIRGAGLGGHIADQIILQRQVGHAVALARDEPLERIVAEALAQLGAVARPAAIAGLVEIPCG